MSNTRDKARILNGIQPNPRKKSGRWLDYSNQCPRIIRADWKRTPNERYSLSVQSINTRSQSFDHTSRALATAYAHCDQAVAPAAPPQLMEHLHGELGARAAQRVAQRDRAAI